MPYCPKCDMEFVEGVTVCTDCGGPLAESEEAYREELKRQREQALAEKAALYRSASGAEDSFSPEDIRSEESSHIYGGGPSELSEPLLETVEDEAAPIRQRAGGPYVSTRQKCDDMRSSASAFLLVGAVITFFSAACWAGIVRLPMADGSRLFFQGVITVMGLALLLISYRTKASIAFLKTQIEGEERRTKELIEWFLASWDAGRLDQRLLEEDSSLSEAELDLKRFELIQDLLITGQDLPEQAYVDFLAEEIFGRLYQS